MPRDADFKQSLGADIYGFSAECAAVRCRADDRQALEQLCSTITRPALANERVQTNAAGRVVLQLNTPWCDGTTHLVIKNKTPYLAKAMDYKALSVQRNAPRWMKMLIKHGHMPTAAPAAA